MCWVSVVRWMVNWEQMRGSPRGVGVLVPLFPSKIGLCSIVPTVFSLLFLTVPNLLAPPPPNPLLLDSGLYVAALKSLMLTDRYFLFCYLQLISNSKYFSYPWNQLTKLLVAFSTDSNFKWPTNCYFIQILLPIKRNRRSNTTISWGASTFVMMGAGPKVH